MPDTPIYAVNQLPSDPATWPQWRKTPLTSALRITGPFTVVTREGALTCPDGWLAVDSHGDPYPIADDEFRAIYEPGWVGPTGPEGLR